jgi:surfeit locus 1 family protein
MHWKQDIVAKLAEAGQQPPRDLASIDLERLPPGEAGRFIGAKATGRFLHDQEVYVFWTRGNQPGYLVLTPLQPRTGTAILVNRGFVPERLRRPSARPQGQVAGEVTVEGLLVRARPATSIFTPEPDVAGRIWYHLAPAEMAASLDLKVVPTHTLAAGETSNPGGWPQGRSAQSWISDIPNRHFEYALTWWGLALTLLGVYIAYAVGRLRRPPAAPGRQDLPGAE